MNTNSIAELKNRTSGEVIVPENPEYDSVRNAFYQEGSPAVVVRPKNTDDIVAAIRFARAQNLTLAVRSGGHGLHGLSTNNGGLVIDLSHFNTVEILDAEKGRVRIGAGAHWGDAAKSLAAHGLAISSGDTISVGVGGLTLGGGIGWMVRKYGLTIDSLVAAEIVTANGRTLHVSEQAHPDLFWAIRGGGGNFGVVTSFDFHAQPVSTVFGGMVTYDASEVKTVLPAWASAMREAPEELNSTIVLFSGFGPQMPPQIMILLCYAGDDEAAANKAINPLLQLGTIKQQHIQKKPYHDMLEKAMTPPGIRGMSHDGFVKTLNQEVFDALTANYGRPGTPIAQIRYLGGAMARVSPQTTAFAHRANEALAIVAAFVPKDASPEQAQHVMQAAWAPLAPLTSGAYGNFLSDTSSASIAEVYPSATYARLASVKATYDPENVFNQNQNIKPAR